MDTAHFDKLSQDKRLAVINAGLSCFGRDGYKKTAISEIAAAAGVSKAAIFHYFGTKKDLYLYLFNYAYGEILAGQTDGTEDFFECLDREIQNRVRLDAAYPGLYNFVNLLTRRTDHEDIRELCEIQEAAADQSPLFDKVDWSRFRDGYDRETAMNLATWVSLGCLAQFAGEKSKEEIYAELKRYLNILKQALYKPEYLK